MNAQGLLQLDHRLVELNEEVSLLKLENKGLHDGQLIVTHGGRMTTSF